MMLLGPLSLGSESWEEDKKDVANWRAINGRKKPHNGDHVYLHIYTYCVFRTRDTQKASMLEFHGGISSEVKKYCSFQVGEDQDQDQRSLSLEMHLFFQICFFSMMFLS